MSAVRLRRVYEPRAPGDGLRVLVDRLWPRGLRREDADVDVWLKEIAPSAELRRWYGHDLERWPDFCQRYEAELVGNPALEELRSLHRAHETTTLLFAKRDTEHNNAIVLQRLLSGEASSQSG
jgi:uncharacterized protein YeaO (DUF488 family)